MTNFICDNCGYRMETEKKPGECQFCGERGTMKKEQTADELLSNMEE